MTGPIYLFWQIWGRIYLWPNNIRPPSPMNYPMIYVWPNNIRPPSPMNYPMIYLWPNNIRPPPQWTIQWYICDQTISGPPPQWTIQWYICDQTISAPLPNERSNDIFVTKQYQAPLPNELSNDIFVTKQYQPPSPMNGPMIYLWPNNISPPPQWTVQWCICDQTISAPLPNELSNDIFYVAVHVSHELTNIITDWQVSRFWDCISIWRLYYNSQCLFIKIVLVQNGYFLELDLHSDPPGVEYNIPVYNAHVLLLNKINMRTHVNVDFVVLHTWTVRIISRRNLPSACHEKYWICVYHVLHERH